MKLVRWLKREWECARFGLPNSHPIDVFFDMVREWVASAHCKIRGHDLKDVSVAGPDSGNMALECQRCGQGWCTWLY